MRVAIVCIAKLENRYIREFVKYHYDLGIDDMFICDNNDIDGEWLEPILDDYIENGFVHIYNARGVRSTKEFSLQFLAYSKIYADINKKFDWLIFIDCDEFIVLNGFSNIKKYLSQDKFNKFDVIHLNWMCYNDNNQVKDNGKPLSIRFTNALPLNDSVNKHVKSIVRGGLNIKSYLYTDNAHTPMYSDLRYCNNCGDETVAYPWPEPNFEDAYIKHYVTKTIQEYINVKMKRGYAYYDPVIRPEFRYTLEKFFSSNEITQEKLDYLKSIGINTDNITDNIKKE